MQRVMHQMSDTKLYLSLGIDGLKGFPPDRLRALGINPDEL